jgi:predicted component of type VI protein secretion system
VQSAKTGLARETARTNTAKTKVDLELETHRSVNTAIKDGAKNPTTIVIK